MTIQRQTNISQGRNDFSQQGALEWLAPRMRDDLAQMPDATRLAAIARAVELANRRPGSYLAKHLQRLYGSDEALNKAYFDIYGEYPF